MPKVASSQFALLLVDGYNLLAAKVQSWSDEIELELEPTDGLGDSWREKSPTGMWTATIAQSGAFFDTQVAGIHAAMKDAPTTERVIAWAIAGNVLGAAFKAVRGACTSKYGVLSTSGKLTKANVSYAVTGQLDEGVIIETHAQRAADWTGTTVDDAASSPDGGVGYLEVSELTGVTGAVVTIQDSPDGSTWADLITFATVTAAPNAQRIEVAGTVDRYLRVVGDVTGAGTITSFVGFARN